MLNLHCLCNCNENMGLLKMERNLQQKSHFRLISRAALPGDLELKIALTPLKLKLDQRNPLKKTLKEGENTFICSFQQFNSMSQLNFVFEISVQIDHRGYPFFDRESL